jgi:hypothetical protein
LSALDDLPDESGCGMNILSLAPAMRMKTFSIFPVLRSQPMVRPEGKGSPSF